MAAKEVFVLSEDDYRVLRQLIDKSKKTIVNTQNRYTDSSNRLSFDSDIYIVKTPVAGIAARTTTTPPSSVCDVYNLYPTTSVDINSLQSVGNFQLEVYNVHDVAIPGETWVLAVKDKYGNYMCASTPCFVT